MKIQITIEIDKRQDEQELLEHKPLMDDLYDSIKENMREKIMSWLFLEPVRIDIKELKEDIIYGSY